MVGKGRFAAASHARARRLGRATRRQLAAQAPGAAGGGQFAGRVALTGFGLVVGGGEVRKAAGQLTGSVLGPLAGAHAEVTAATGRTLNAALVVSLANGRTATATVRSPDAYRRAQDWAMRFNALAWAEP